MAAGQRLRVRGRAGAVASCVAVALLVPAGAAQAAPGGPSGVRAQGAYLLDGQRNKALWNRTADTQRPMASVTKVMTAVVVLETPGMDLSRRVTVKQAYRDHVAEHGASTADLKKGDRLTVGQLLYGLMLPSGCDAAYALADTFGTGTTAQARTRSFVARMNKKAESLGMTRTRFDSFDGVSTGGRNHSTPRDLARLGRRALGNTTFTTVVKSPSTRQKAANGRVYTWYNTNKLLGTYSGTVGVKTGSGTTAGPCLLFAAKRNGRTVVGVALNSADRFRDAQRMLDWAYGPGSPK
ncbi:serine hydrolase [Streptomyces sp. 549]|uniref:D-alanyl-D-alanine carboxypeptidase family protein n=1 Tax=Streptomyces sp. 549 TaxID=3049076 RepID=UPI0024C3B313|nr:serine hydrolase [Streptomyces sp. 549]MDK1475804.1 serine hydrolase [Streptomyces sp. 549]